MSWAWRFLTFIAVATLSFGCTLEFDPALLGDGGVPPRDGAPLPDGFVGGACLTPMQIAATDDHACVVDRAGSGQCWGENGTAQLGVGDTEHRDVAIEITGGASWTLLEPGSGHTCGIQADGSLWCWGENDYGQLGIGDSATQLSPVRIGTDSDWISLGAGNNHTCGVRADGSLWCWGDNCYGQIAQEDGDSRSAPTRVGSETDWASVSSAVNHTCALKSNGQLWCFGNGGSGQLGDSNGDNSWTPVMAISAVPFVEVGVGDYHSCARGMDGSLWCWGDNCYGQLGIDGGFSSAYEPTRVGTDSDWEALGVGEDHTCALRASGTLWCWGDGSQGQLGSGSTESFSTPVMIGAGGPWTDIVAGDDFTCGVATDGRIACWGENFYGALGIGTAGFRADRGEPTEVPGGPWSDVSTGGAETCAIRGAGELHCWGRTDGGRLGFGTSAMDVPSPTRVGTDADWVQVQTYDGHTCARKNDGSVWCTGNGGDGALGNGGSESSSMFIMVPGLPTATVLESGDKASCILSDTSALWCWGDNGHGSLGVGDEDDRFLPLEVAMGTTWNSVGMGDDVNCGIQTDGSLWCSGESGYGALGLGDSVNFVNVPTPGGQRHGLGDDLGRGVSLLWNQGRWHPAVLGRQLLRPTGHGRLVELLGPDRGDGRQLGAGGSRLRAHLRRAAEREPLVLGQQRRWKTRSRQRLIDGGTVPDRRRHGLGACGCGIQAHMRAEDGRAPVLLGQRESRTDRTGSDRWRCRPQAADVPVRGVEATGRALIARAHTRVG